MDPQLAETHTALGFLETLLLNFAAGTTHFQTSHQLKPEQPLTIRFHATLAAAEGRLDDAIAMAHRASQLEPHPSGCTSSPKACSTMYSDRIPLRYLDDLQGSRDGFQLSARPGHAR